MLLLADRPQLRVGAAPALARHKVARWCGSARLGAPDCKIRPASRSQNSRLQSKVNADAAPPADDAYIYRVVDAIDAIAEETGKSVPQIALNWLLQRPTVATLVIGARDEAQLKQNLGAVGWNLTPAQVQKLDEASATPRAYPYFHQAGFERNPRRRPELRACQWSETIGESLGIGVGARGARRQRVRSAAGNEELGDYAMSTRCASACSRSASPRSGCIIEGDKAAPTRWIRGAHSLCLCPRPHRPARASGCVPCGENETAERSQCVCKPGFGASSAAEAADPSSRTHRVRRMRPAPRPHLTVREAAPRPGTARRPAALPTQTVSPAGPASRARACVTVRPGRRASAARVRATPTAPATRHATATRCCLVPVCSVAARRATRPARTSGSLRTTPRCSARRCPSAYLAGDAGAGGCPQGGTKVGP